MCADDEDERGLDRLEREDGDMDDLDEDEVREEVERIHHREVLNQDQREIKYIQEVMLEDGDLHSDNARTRKFRWNGLGKSHIIIQLYINPLTNYAVSSNHLCGHLRSLKYRPASTY